MRHPIEYGKIKTNVRTLEDAIMNLGTLKDSNKHFNSKEAILKALTSRDIETLRQISEYYYDTNGIYERICRYAAYLYRYDWYIVPQILNDKIGEEKVMTEFNSLLTYLDNSHIKQVCGNIALEVIKQGAYYGYISDISDKIVLQQLPINYCRSRYFKGDNPAVEFNMKFFDEQFRDINYRMRVLKMFPPEFSKGYLLYKQGKLTPDCSGEQGSWYLLDPKYSVKFNINNSDVPLFVNAVPNLIDLDAAQDLDRRKQMQKLLKIVIQKLPLDKNGDLIFDVDEAADIHNNAVEMLSRAVGVDVLTTFTDVEVADMSDSNTTTSKDDLSKVERTVYNSLGISQNLFNTDSNMSLEKSILNDESSLRTLLLQFHIFFDRIVQERCKNKKKVLFNLYMLETTQYNYKDLSKMYKEQVQIGYSKMLPQIALGHSQSSIIHTAFFENNVLHLNELMVPPLQSSTMNAEALATVQRGGSKRDTVADVSGSLGSSESAGGRPEKPDDEKSDKTIANKESM